MEDPTPLQKLNGYDMMAVYKYARCSLPLRLSDASTIEERCWSGAQASSNLDEAAEFSGKKSRRDKIVKRLL